MHISPADAAAVLQVVGLIFVIALLMVVAVRLGSDRMADTVRGAVAALLTVLVQVISRDMENKDHDDESEKHD